MNKSKNINVFTDGSCRINKSKSHYGGLAVYIDDLNIKNITKSYYAPDVTNQRMELQACILGIEKVIKSMYKTNYKDDWTINVYTDSMYSINCATKWAKKWILYNWKRVVNNKLVDVCNTDLIKKLYTLTSTYPVKFYHVKSHQYEPDKNSTEWYTWNGNNIADKLAGEAMAKSYNKNKI